MKKIVTTKIELRKADKKLSSIIYNEDITFTEETMYIPKCKVSEGKVFLSVGTVSNVLIGAPFDADIINNALSIHTTYSFTEFGTNNRIEFYSRERPIYDLEGVYQRTEYDVMIRVSTYENGTWNVIRDDVLYSNVDRNSGITFVQFGNGISYDINTKTWYLTVIETRVSYPIGGTWGIYNAASTKFNAVIDNLEDPLLRKTKVVDLSAEIR